MNVPAFSKVFQHCQSIWEWKPGNCVGYDAYGDPLWGGSSDHPRKMLEKTVRCPQPQLGNPRTKCEHINGCSNLEIIIYKSRFRWENDLEMQALIGHAMIYICGSVTASISYSSYVWGHRRKPRNMLVYLGVFHGMHWRYVMIYADLW